LAPGPDLQQQQQQQQQRCVRLCLITLVLGSKHNGYALPKNYKVTFVISVLIIKTTITSPIPASHLNTACKNPKQLQYIVLKCVDCG
jgi:hypothetical protein